MHMLSAHLSAMMYILSHPPSYSKTTSQRSPEKKQAFFYHRAQCRIKLPLGLTYNSPLIQLSRMHGLTYTGKFACCSRNIFANFVSMEAGGVAFHSGANSIPIIPANGMLSRNRSRSFIHYFLMTRAPSYLGGH